MTRPRVLALDLSLTATGVALPNGDLGTVSPAAADGERRLVRIRDWVRCAVDNHDPWYVVLEGYVVRSGAASVLGMLHGAVRVELIDQHVPYLTVPPATLKVYATGGGRAQKPDMRMALYKRTGRDIDDDNQVDAAWLRLLGLDLCDRPEVDLPQTHRRALDRLRLPEGVGT